VQITFASLAAPGHVNEDYVIAGPTWVAVFDGATPRAGVTSGCIHDVPWLVSRLASHLSWALAMDDAVPLADALAGAIEATRKAHANTCDLDNPDSPSSTVTILRQRPNDVDYLVLADSPVLIQADDGLQAITDDRTAHLPAYTAEAIRAARNQPGGFWVASTKPQAAHEAVTGSLPRHTLTRAALVTDGVVRWVDRVHLGSWDDLAEALFRFGPLHVVDQIRRAEQEQLPPVSTEPNGRMVKRHDDATVALVTWKEC